MASRFLIPSSASASVARPLPAAGASFKPSYATTETAFGFSGHPSGRKTRGLTAVTRASASSYAYAFILPLSLIAVTVFTSIRVADKLDEQFLEELAIDQAIKEGEGEDAEFEISMEEMMQEEVQEPVLPRTRNRPKREV